MTSGRTIDYEALTQDALRSVVRTVLGQAAKSGLPGDHHFYIGFDTQAPGVAISRRLREKYPEEMMIVLQHRFWDLGVTDDRFEVKLTFDGIPERLVVPFEAIKVFFDPSVRFSLQFGDAGAGEDAQDGRAMDGDGEGRGMRGTRGDRRPRRPRPRPEKPAEAAPQQPAPASSALPAAPAPSALVPRVEPAAKPQPAAPAASSAPPPAPQAEPQPAPGAKVVSLDQFRKK